MKLLFDENLSPNLVPALSIVYPGSTHVDAVGLHGRADLEIWRYAKEHDHVIVSKDGDFRQLCILNGPPPKFVHLQIGNAGSREIIDLLKVKYSAIAEFGAAWQESVMILR